MRRFGHDAVVMDHHAVGATIDDERVQQQRPGGRDLRRRVDEDVVVGEFEMPLPGGCDGAVHDRPGVGRRDVQRHRILLVTLHVQEQRPAVPIGVRAVQMGERARHRGVREDAVRDAHAVTRAGEDAPQRAVDPVPAQRLSIARRRGKVLHVLREIHAAVAPRRPHGHLQIHGPGRDSAQRERDRV